MKFIADEKKRFRVRYVVPMVTITMAVIIAVCIEIRGFFALWVLII